MIKKIYGIVALSVVGMILYAVTHMSANTLMQIVLSALILYLIFGQNGGDKNE